MMLNFIFRLIFFLVINFAALFVGVLLMGDTVQGEWYANLNKALWTPPGWVFGAAWTSIMVLFSVFMSIAATREKISAFDFHHPMVQLFWLQWILNVSWNGLFFNQHLVLLGLIDILALLLVIGFILRLGKKLMGWHTMWALPYCLWLIVATSLNGYIFLYN